MTKIEEIELIESEYKVIRKFSKTGLIRLESSLINANNISCYDALIIICNSVNCDFDLVLKAVCETVK